MSMQTTDDKNVDATFVNALSDGAKSRKFVAVKIRIYHKFNHLALSNTKRTQTHTLLCVCACPFKFKQVSNQTVTFRIA